MVFDLFFCLALFFSACVYFVQGDYFNATTWFLLAHLIARNAREVRQ
jgi:hypothetical protein